MNHVLENQKVTPIATHLHFKENDLLIFFNKWNGYVKPDEQKWFRPLSSKQCCELKPGDEIWISSEPDPYGKVYGYRLAIITSAVKDGVNYVIRYRFGTMRINRRESCTNIVVLTNEKQVYDWTKNEPRARYLK